MDSSEIAFYLLKYLTHNHIDKLSEKYKLDVNEIKELIENSEEKNQAVMEIMESIGRKRGALVSRRKSRYKQNSKYNTKRL